MKFNVYVMLLLSGSFLQASHNQSQNEYLTAPAGLQSQVVEFIEQDNQREKEQMQKIKDSRTSLLLASAKVLSHNESLTRVELKKIRDDLSYGLEKSKSNEQVFKVLKAIKKNHERAFYIGSSFVADNVLQEEKTNLKHAIKVILSKEISENIVSSEVSRSCATQTGITQENIKLNAFGVPSAPPAPGDDSQI